MFALFVHGRGRWVVFLSALSIEDFQYNIAARFGLPVLLAAFLLSIAYAVQVYGSALAANERPLGFVINLALALIWFWGAVLDHLGEILFANPYRSGLVSKGLEVGIILVSAAWAVASAAALWQEIRAR